MPHLLLNFRGVPEDEIEEVRDLLAKYHFPVYETRPGPFGISAGGIWLPDDADLANAKRLLADYQRERQARARAEWEAAKADGTAPTLLDQFRAEPVRISLALGGAALLVVLTVGLPWWFLSR
jgi:hypothetical protein